MDSHGDEIPGYFITMLFFFPINFLFLTRKGSIDHSQINEEY
jgi:hypothetical protein